MSVDSEINEVRVVRQNGFSIGYNAAEDYSRVYTFDLVGIAVDGVTQTSQPINFNLNFDCCYEPTVITAPVTLDSVTDYSYNIGDPKLTIRIVDADDINS